MKNIAIIMKENLNSKTMSYSNQFPRQQDKPKEPLTMKDKADFIFRNIEDKMPKLFERIMKANNDMETDKRI